MFQDFTALPTAATTPLIKKGDAALQATWPAITATDILDYTRTGTRIFFEEKYFARRHLLNDLVMAEIVTMQGRYIDAIINGVWSICEESGWQLPPHNSYVRDTPVLELPDVTAPVVELFSCETAASLALIYHLLGDSLEAAAPDITNRISYELHYRVINPYLEQHFWWMGNGDEKMCNWTPWCTQNVLLVAALIPNTDEKRMAICEKAIHSLNCFLKDYGDDGCCDEGAKYYGHAGLCLYVALEMLEKLLPADSQSGKDATYLPAKSVIPCFTNKKIHNIADFIRQMHVAGDFYINFADCPPILEPPNALVYLFGKHTGNADLSAFAAEGIRRRGIYTPSKDLSLYTRLTELSYAEEIQAFDAKPNSPTDKYFPSAGVLIARDIRTCLAVKAGNNNDNHNHNDVGSITLYVDNEPFLIDVGVGSYTRDTFSQRRYTIWTMQSAYHNLPTFGGIMQSAGKQYKATDVECHILGNETSISMDIASAYPPEAGVKQYKREVRLKKEGGVFVHDIYEGTHPAELSLMLPCRPVISEGIIDLSGKGKITTYGATDIRVETINVTDPILQKSWGNELFRVIITFQQQLKLEIQPFTQLPESCT